MDALMRALGPRADVTGSGSRGGARGGVRGGGVRGGSHHGSHHGSHARGGAGNATGSAATRQRSAGGGGGAGRKRGADLQGRLLHRLHAARANVTGVRGRRSSGGPYYKCMPGGGGGVFALRAC